MTNEDVILVVSDDPVIRQELETIIRFLDEPVIAVSTQDWQSAAGESIANGGLRCMILDADGPTEIIPALRAMDASVPVLLLGDTNVDDLDEEDRRRIIARLQRPLSYTKFNDSLYRAQIFREHHSQNRVRAQQRELQLFRSLVGTSRAICRVRELMAQVADKEVSVLITGESGTGKEVVARNLHYNSHRRNKPFVPVNCGAIPAELLESELFGHEKGAFTGAISTRVGRFELAQGGTLFLDEIGDMPLHMQVKILRVLQERTFERVGSNKTQQADVRIIAATHKNLEEMIEKGEFREDLYYRLNVFPIEMPALRERVEDIPLLLNELVSRMEKEKRGSLRFNSAAILSLCRHDWPGNVRELANLVERLAIMHPYGVIGVHELPPKFRHVDDLDEERPEALEALKQQGVPGGLPGLDAPAMLPVNGLDLKEYLANLEKTLIRQALEDAGGVVARAAEKLHIRRTTLVEKLKKYQITADAD